MSQDAGAPEGVKTGEEELLDFEFEELDEKGLSESLEELTSEDIIDLVDVVEEGEPLELTPEAAGAKTRAEVPDEEPLLEAVDKPAAEPPEGEILLETPPAGEEAGSVVEVQPEAVSDDAASQSIEMEIDAALKGLEIADEETQEVSGDKAAEQELALDLGDLEAVASEELPAQGPEEVLDVAALEEETAPEAGAPLQAPLEEVEAVEVEAAGSEVPQPEPDAALEGISEEQIVKMAEGMDLEERIEEGPSEVEALGEAEADSGELGKGPEEVPLAEEGEVAGPMEAQGPPAEAGAALSEMAGAAAGGPVLEGISEEKMQEILNRVVRESVEQVVRETVERVARETMTEVAEKVITEAIEALKNSLESTPA